MSSEMEVNDQGGRQSGTPYCAVALPPLALLRIARVMKQGAIDHEDDPFGNMQERNWHKITAQSNFDHALIHAILFMLGDTSEDHAGHFATRATMFLHQHLKETGEAP